MKLVNYKLQTQMENLNESSTNTHFKEYSKIYFRRFKHSILSKKLII